MGEPDHVEHSDLLPILFRPSADSVHCASSNGWWDGACPQRYLSTNITFNLAAQSITLPRSIIYGISYDTQNQGPSPPAIQTIRPTPLNIASANPPHSTYSGIEHSAWHGVHEYGE